ncbi:MipA/OmpV family protein [Pseudoalteromonas sp. NEC-BIFX-2020_002]|uniref:MipA/OmpV family protein n=1 Tax=Pseudoalteromonas sp. NEC-BIFX-2020_002 TaxID=2732353 RepID=UPI0014776BAC|nr:MipA/OmpV family protein [Pseudoalteromonas sp. NEC-BIFX-2020_002]NNG42294.1 MipA/OmpV family protein [Pseudoalteromonas sp. NEC-BIFX-2020_002]
MKLIVKTFALICIYCQLSVASATEQQSGYDKNIATQQWHISLNTGLGVITNPLHGGDNLPVVLIPEVAFYGEKFFFDNGRLGYTLEESSRHIFNLITELNPETRFFVKWHPTNVFALASKNSVVFEQNQLENQQPRVKITDLDKRKWALDAGLSYHYVKDKHVFSLQVLTDITGVYDGNRAAVQWQMHETIGRLKLKPSLGVWYKSASLNTYFYGVSEQEHNSAAIEVGRSWQPYAKIDGRWPLGNNNSLRFHVAYYDYSALNESPLFEKKYSITAFIGFNHIF